MPDDFKWLIGQAVVLMTVILGAFYRLSGRIDKVKDDYVRRDDLNGHIQRLEKSVAVIRDEMRKDSDSVRDDIKQTRHEMNERLDRLIREVVSKQ